TVPWTAVTRQAKAIPGIASPATPAGIPVTRREIIVPPAAATAPASIGKIRFFEVSSRMKPLKGQRPNKNSNQNQRRTNNIDMSLELATFTTLKGRFGRSNKGAFKQIKRVMDQTHALIKWLESF